MTSFTVNQYNKLAETNRHWLVAALVVLILAIAAHANGLRGEFVFDDRPFVIDNPQLDQGRTLSYFFTENVWSYSNDADNYPRLRYRPLYFASLWLLNDVWPGSSLAMHAFSLLLHLLASLLVLAAVSRMVPGISPLAAGVGACLFAVHPVHAEAVAWVSALVHPMVAVFLLAAYLFQERFRRTGRKMSQFTALVFFVFALMSNEMAVGFPFFIVLNDWVRESRLKPARLAPYFVLLAIYLLVRNAVLGASVPLHFGDLQAWLTFLGFSAEYLRYLVLPWPQPLHLSMPDAWGPSPVSAVVTVLLIAYLFYLAFRPGLSRQGLLLAVAWVGAALLAPLAAAFSPDAKFALRSLYLPSVGVGVLLAWIVHVTPCLQRRWGLGFMALLALLSTGISIAANRDWLDDGRVYWKIASQYPNDAGKNLYLGEYMEHIGKVPEALRLYRRAVAVAGPEKRLEAMDALATLLGKSGDSSGSLDVFRQMTALNPESASAWIGIGNNLWSMGDLDRAAEAYRMAHEIDAGNWKACANLILLLNETGNPDEAVKYRECADRKTTEDVISGERLQ